ncbi:MAG: hypothetical protein GDYSWBUE_000210 [Candidatus Fervidibacterota bacterium]
MKPFKFTPLEVELALWEVSFGLSVPVQAMSVL